MSMGFEALRILAVLVRSNHIDLIFDCASAEQSLPVRSSGIRRSRGRRRTNESCDRSLARHEAQKVRSCYRLSYCREYLPESSRQGDRYQALAPNPPASLSWDRG